MAEQLIANVSANVSAYQKAMSTIAGTTKNAMGAAASASGIVTTAAGKTGGFVSRTFASAYALAGRAGGKFSRDVQNYQQQMQNGNGKVGGSVLGMAGKFAAIAGVGSVIQGAVSRVDTLNNSTRTFNNMGFKTSDVKSAMTNLEGSIKGLPTSLDSAVKGVQLFASSTGDIDLAQKSWSAVNNAILGFGGTAAQAENATTQLSQAFSNGKIDAETWNSMIDSGMGPALNALAKNSGMSMKEFKSGLSDGSISVEQFQNDLIQLNTKGGGGIKSLEQIAKDSTKGIGTGWQNMKTAMVRGMAEIITAIGPENISSAISGIGTAFANIAGFVADLIKKFIEFGQTSGLFENIATTIKNVAQFVQEAVQKIMEFDKATGIVRSLAVGVVAVVGAIKLYRTTVMLAAGAMRIFNAVMALNPFTVIVLAIVGVVAALVYFFTQTKLGKKIWQGFTEWIKGAWSGMVEFFSGIWNGITEFDKKAVEAIKTGWNAVKDFFANLWNSIKTAVVTTVTELASGLATKWEEIKQAFANTFNALKELGVTIWNGIKTGISMLVSGLVTFLVSRWTNLKNNTTQLFNAIKSVASSVWNAIKSVVTTIVKTWFNIVKGIFDTWKSFMTQLWNVIKSVATSVWNAIKTAVTAIIRGWINIAKGLFNGFKSAVSAIWNGIKSVTSSVWNAIKSVAVNLARALINGVKAVWNGLKGIVSGIWNGVKSAIQGALNFDLGAAGRAIMESFLNGLKAVYENVKNFVGGIADWIKKHKGPISYDRKLLIPAGRAIMGGFGKSLESNFQNVKKNVSSYASQIAREFDGQSYTANASLTASASGVASYISGGLASLSDEVAEQTAQQPVFEVFNEIVGDKIKTTVNSKNARREATVSLMRGKG